MSLNLRTLTCLALAATLAAGPALAQLKTPQRAASQRSPALAPRLAPPPAEPAEPASATPQASSEHKDMEEAGTRAAQGWLFLVDRRDWGGSWEASSLVFRKNVPLAAWMDGIPKQREPLGALVERQLVRSEYKTELQGQGTGEYVTAVFDSRYANLTLRELVTTVKESDGRWRVTGYSTQ